MQPPLCRFAVLVGSLASGLASTVGAAVIYIAPAGGIPIPTNFSGVSLDLETGATSTDLNGLPLGDVNFYFGGAELTNDADISAAVPTWQPVRTGPGNTDPVANLSVLATVDGAGLYATGFGSSGDIATHFPPFTAGQSGYIGFSMVPNAGGAPLYGWIQVTLQNDGSTPGLNHAWAFEDSGAPIQVGAVPEPGAAMLPFLGVLGLLVRRKRQAA